MGTAELGALLGTVAMLFVGLLAFLGRGVFSDIRELQNKAATHETALAVQAAARVNERLDSLEKGFADVRADVRVIRAWVDRQTGHLRRQDGEITR